MPDISTTKTPSQKAAVTVAKAAFAAKKARASLDRAAAKRGRFMGAIVAGGKTIVVSFARTIYVLWLQVTGLIFVMFAVMGVSALAMQYKKDHFADRHRLYITILFIGVCSWFGLVSFLRAKKKGK
ncbi:MAG: hypothetical protein ACM3SW_03565 [Actinomycetota bacterium]